MEQKTNFEEKGQGLPQSAIEKAKAYFLGLQGSVCNAIEAEEENGAIFIEEVWEHEGGGGGSTRTLAHGQVIEKAGVNFSHVYGLKLPPAATARRPQLLDDSRFQAMGVSVVIHPLNPYVPTAHMNVRFVKLEKHGQHSVWWFGGGFDLTPYYASFEDCVYWHQMAQAACRPFGESVYPEFKHECDAYFYLPHRKEARGIGGIFFDDLNEWGFEQSFEFIKRVGEHFTKAYCTIVARRKQMPYGQRERQFQLYRRGRYVEFNLLYDRGTLFGLQSGGRAESILMSLPPLVAWERPFHVEPGSQEERLYTDFLVPRPWAGLK